MDKLRDRWRTLGPREAIRTTVEDARRRVVDDRVVLVLRVDLADPKNRLRERDRRAGELELLPFDGATLPRVLAAVEPHEPWRVGSVRQRFFEGARGFVAVRGEEVLGYVFYTEGTDSPHRLVHGDLRWLGIQPKRGELYVFDYYLLERARGLGNLFARAVQEAHFRLGYRAAYGWVAADNRAAAWLYRTTGWIEVARLDERRILNRLAVVGPSVYWMEPWSRRRIARLPPWLRASTDGSSGLDTKPVRTDPPGSR